MYFGFAGAVVGAFAVAIGLDLSVFIFVAGIFAGVGLIAAATADGNAFASRGGDS